MSLTVSYEKTEKSSYAHQTEQWVFWALHGSSWASQVVLVVKSLPANAGDLRDAGSISTCPGGGHGNLFQCSCQENPMDWGDLWTIDHRGAKSRTQLKWLSMHGSNSSKRWFFPHGSVQGNCTLQRQLCGFQGLLSPCSVLYPPSLVGWPPCPSQKPVRVRS